jgi:hypothetical protein
MRLSELFEEKYYREHPTDVGRSYWQDLAPHYKTSSQMDAEGKPDFTPETWPPSGADLKRIEGKVMQNPEWLAFYAYFGWRSWTQVTVQKYLDKHKNTFAIYNVPAISYHPNRGSKAEPDHLRVVFDLDGNIVDTGGTYRGELISIPLPGALDLARRYVKQMFTPENKAYMLGRYYVRFGLWRDDERSQNFLASREEGHPVWEKGVSAYHADWEMEEQRWAIGDGINENTLNGTMDGLFSATAKGKRDIFLVQGTELEDDGADGEPLLHNVKMVKRLALDDIYVPGVFDPREDDGYY